MPIFSKKMTKLPSRVGQKGLRTGRVKFWVDFDHRRSSNILLILRYDSTYFESLAEKCTGDPQDTRIPVTQIHFMRALNFCIR